MVKTRLLLALLLLPALTLTAESEVTVELTSLLGAARSDADAPAVTGSSEAELSYRSTDNRDVKSELTLTAAVSESASLDVSRAWIKARFPGFRLTAGKTRLAWGEGFMFNAGDVLFDSLSTAADLSGDEIRTAGKWLASAYVPLGRFSFVEGVVLPPQLDPFAYAVDSRLYAQGLAPAPELPGGDETSGGGRIVLKPAGIKLEAGYLYDGPDASHRPYVSLQGNLIVDWHLSAATELDAAELPDSDPGENLAVSFGLFRIMKVGYSSDLNLRLEGVVRPAAVWEADAAASSGLEEYGLYLYPELSFAPDDRRSVFYRAVVSPVDLSAAHIVGMNWNIYQGFDLLFYGGANSGESGDRFAFDASYASGHPGWFLSAGCEFAF